MKMCHLAFGALVPFIGSSLCFAEIEEFKSDIAIARHGCAKVEAPLLAIGNSGGAGVLTVIAGKAKSLGSDTSEVSNQVIQGNSGGPVFSGKSGELLGVVTHATAARKDAVSGVKSATERLR